VLAGAVVAGPGRGGHRRPGAEDVRHRAGPEHRRRPVSLTDLIIAETVVGLVAPNKT
jgi:hypothetical protein